MKIEKFRKRDYLLLGIVLIIAIISLINIYFEFLNQTILDVITVAILLLSFLILGFQKNKSVIEKDILLTIVSFVLGFNLIIYLLGLFIGFTKSIYSTQFVMIIRNVAPLIIYIILIELERYIIISNCKHSKLLIILATISFILIDNTILLADLYISDNMGIMGYVRQLGLFIVPNIITNIYLTYLVSKVGYKSSIVYRLLMEIPLYIIPIYPNFGDYILSIIRITIPSGFIFYLNKYISKIVKDKIVLKNNIMAIPLRIFVIGVCFTLVYFVCGKFRYQAYVIASGSMIPKINIGDVVIIDKKFNKELEIGDVIAFKRDNQIFCHRINEIIEAGKDVLYETKGDNNKDVDQLLVSKDDVVGLTNFKIRYIGLPTVWLINTR